MFFNYLSKAIFVPRRETINIVSNNIAKIDEDLNYGINDLFLRIPINLVDVKSLNNEFKDYQDKYLNQCKSKGKEVLSGGYEASRYYKILEDSFEFSPTSLLINKGLSSFGKELLICADEFAIDYDDKGLQYHLLTRTIFPLCNKVLEDKNHFPISKHFLYPIFVRYMEIPLSVAMTIAATECAFGKDSYEVKELVYQFDSLPRNYQAGILLYKCGIHSHWIDWRDNKKRCEGKIDTIKEWIDYLSSFRFDLDEKKIKTLWCELFDVTLAELATAPYAPVISKNKDLRTLMSEFYEYVEENKMLFQGKGLENSNNYLSLLICEIVYRNLPSYAAIQKLPIIIQEKDVNIMINNDFPGWSFAKEIESEEYCIYGPVKEIAIKIKTVKAANPSYEV